MLSAIAELQSTINREYLDLLYRQYYSMLYHLAYSIVRENNDAEDVVTDAMLSLTSLVPKLRAMKERERVGYLRATVRNTAYKHYKASKRQNRTEILPLESILFSLGTQEDDPAQLLEKDEELRKLQEAIVMLSVVDREILFLKYSARLTASEISELIKAPSEEAVQKRLSRARRKVLRLLEDWGWAHERENS